jgi:hypothetical protein
MAQEILDRPDRDAAHHQVPAPRSGTRSSTAFCHITEKLARPSARRPRNRRADDRRDMHEHRASHQGQARRAFVSQGVEVTDEKLAEVNPIKEAFHATGI